MGAGGLCTAPPAVEAQGKHRVEENGVRWAGLAPWGHGEWGRGAAAHVQEGAADHVENDAAQGPDVSFLAEGEVEGFRGHPGLLNGVCGPEKVGARESCAPWGRSGSYNEPFVTLLGGGRDGLPVWGQEAPGQQDPGAWPSAAEAAHPGRRLPGWCPCPLWPQRQSGDACGREAKICLLLKHRAPLSVRTLRQSRSTLVSKPEPQTRGQPSRGLGPAL